MIIRLFMLTFPLMNRRERKHRMPHYQTGVTVLKGICKQLRFSSMLQLMTDCNCLFIHLFNAPKSLQVYIDHVHYGARAVLVFRELYYSGKMLTDLAYY